jgi:hypothetical protein
MAAGGIVAGGLQPRLTAAASANLTLQLWLCNRVPTNAGYTGTAPPRSGPDLCARLSDADCGSATLRDELAPTWGSSVRVCCQDRHRPPMRDTPPRLLGCCSLLSPDGCPHHERRHSLGHLEGPERYGLQRGPPGRRDYRSTTTISSPPLVL